MIVRNPLGNTDRYEQRCKYYRTHGDDMFHAFLFLLSIALILGLLSAL